MLGVRRFMLPAVGDKVTLVVPGVVTAVDDEGGTGLFDVDYGPGWVVAAEGMLLEENSVVRGLVEYARRGVVWQRKGPGGYGWVCPRCGQVAIVESKALRGELCSGCRQAVAEGDVCESRVDMALDFLADHLCDAGLDRDEVWKVVNGRRDEIKRDVRR